MTDPRLVTARAAAEQFAGVQLMVELGADLHDTTNESLVAACMVANSIADPAAKRVLTQCAFELGRRGAGDHWLHLACDRIPADLLAQCVPAGTQMEAHS